MTGSAPILSDRDGEWVDEWLSAARLTTYLTAAAGSRRNALALYEWNIAAACAIQQDLCHLEVGLRNAYDAAIRAHWTGPADWTSQPLAMFPPTPSTRGRGGSINPKEVVDVNTRPRTLLLKARQDAGGVAARPGKVIAELSLGFWRYLSVKRHDQTLWVPYLHHAFPPGTDRARDVDARIHRLHTLRNRVAHHEPLLRVNLPGRLADITDLAALISPDLGAYITATTRIPQAIAERP